MSEKSATRPWWQQATALVTVGTGGVVTGLTFAPGTAAGMTSPNGVPPVHLMALEKAASADHDAGTPSPGSPAAEQRAADTHLRSAVVNVARYYLRLAATRTPEQVNALIWGRDSADGADHGPSCAAFASLTLELGAQAVGQQSWVSGGGSYPWPVHSWVDARVGENPDSPQITSVVQDAEAHSRWHPLGDGYSPRPGDWVVFDHHHIEVVTGYSGGALDTIGADSLPGYTINSHTFSSSLADDGVTGFVDNGALAPAGQTPAAQPSAGNTGKSGTATQRAATGQRAQPAQRAATPQRAAARQSAAAGAAAEAGQAVIPGSVAPQPVPHGAQAPRPLANASADAAVIPGPATGTPASGGVSTGGGHPTDRPAASGSAPGQYTRHTPAASTGQPPEATSQREFIDSVAPGAMAAQQRWGVPASVTIAQAIEESNWGTSELAAANHNLFGIKGAGPAGAAYYPTQEFEGGQWITINAAFRAYHNMAESISDHAELLATSGYYDRAMADRSFPDAFAHDLTGIYATDPSYGPHLIAIMKLYDLYRYDTAAPGSASPGASAAPAHQAPPPNAPAATAPTQQATPQRAAAPATSAPSIPGLQTPAQPATSQPTPAQPASSQPATARPAPARARTPKSSTPTTPASAHGSVRQATAGSTGQRNTGQPSTGQPSTGKRSAARGSAQIPGVVTTAMAGSAAANTVLVPAKTASRYEAPLPASTTAAYFTAAKAPVSRGEQLYRDVASRAGISWKLLAACDWMQCQASPRHSPVHGEKLGTVNKDGSVYATRSEALTQCATDLIELADAVYGIDLTVPRPMSVRSLADVYAAFRWGGLLDRHGVSAMEFPYSVAGLTEGHARMHWPAINEKTAPDKPGSKFKQPFGAVPLVLSLKYPATV